MNSKCHKVPYETRESALADARYIRAVKRRYSERGSTKATKRMRAYECRYCCMWHLTNQKQLKKGV